MAGTLFQGISADARGEIQKSGVRSRSDPREGYCYQSYYEQEIHKVGQKQKCDQDGNSRADATKGELEKQC